MLFLNKKNNSKGRQVNPAGGRIGPSYYGPLSKKTPPRSPFQKRPSIKKSPGRFLKTFLRSLVGIAVIVVLIFCLILKSSPRIIISSSAYHPSAVYSAAADKAFGAFRNKTKLTVDKNGIASSLKKQFPEIDTIKIEVPIISQIPTLRISIAVPTFNFSASNNLYIVGSNGVIVGLSSQLANASALPIVIDHSGFSAEPGKQVLGTETIAFINTILAESKRGGVKVESLTLPAAAQELDLRAQNQPYFVKFYLGGDALNQVGQYLAAKHKFDSENTQPQQYLDVRVSGKVFYK